ncbi:beta-ketoacyl-ACP synthase 3 [Catenulispora rubra]|uniref:beta-ketoacyl-ACP synthase 3 n=1 Tax=Catenulispora rubra TaxID=280293 RepID=UPI0018925D22|nr:beta-ketoacyl-ACP synthase 3 [Catenulispora rubra]
MNAIAQPVRARIAGIGGYRPRRVVTNEEVCRQIDSTPEWIERRSGIRTRRFAQPDETLVEMAAIAGAKALGDAGLAPADVDRILVATMSWTPDSPADLAAAVADRLGVHAVAIQVNAACAGFTAALKLAADAVSSGTSGTCLVIGTERMSDIVDPTDRGTAFLFSDGAGAVVVTASKTLGIGPVVWRSRPDLSQAIVTVPGGPDTRPVLQMAGNTVFRWAVSSLPEAISEVLEASGLEAEDLRAFIPHQANLRITRSVAESAGLSQHVAIAEDIVDQGNTSAASIPLAMERMRDSGVVARGDLALLLGFGAGLGFAGMVVAVP